jgi:hypothetical protein
VAPPAAERQAAVITVFFWAGALSHAKKDYHLNLLQDVRARQHFFSCFLGNFGYSKVQKMITTTFFPDTLHRTCHA